MSAPCHTDRPPSPGRDHRVPRSAPSSAHHVRYAIASGTAHTVTRRTNRRTTPTGPSRPKTSASTPNRIVHSHLPSNPKISSERAPAAAAITISSKIVQPTHWITLTPVGRYDPLRPRGALRRTIPGTRPCAPIAAAVASIRFPTMQPSTMEASAAGSESAGTRIAPETITSSDTPRLPQRRPVSRGPRTRCASGTGSIDVSERTQAPVSRRAAAAARTGGCRRVGRTLARAGYRAAGWPRTRRRRR